MPFESVLHLTGSASPSLDSVEYREVPATGRHDAAAHTLVRLQSVGGDEGYYLLTPFVTDRATLLVVRGFVAERADGTPPADITAPPTGTSKARGTVSIRARAQQGQAGNDHPAGIPAGQLTRISPAGGAVEPQHFAYIIQWYLFAALARTRAAHRRAAPRRQARRPLQPLIATAPGGPVRAR